MIRDGHKLVRIINKIFGICNIKGMIILYQFLGVFISRLIAPYFNSMKILLTEYGLILLWNYIMSQTMMMKDIRFKLIKNL